MPSDSPESNPANRQTSHDRARVEVGRVVGSHGLRGQIRVRFFADSPSTLMSCSTVWLGERRDDSNATSYEVDFAGTGRANEARLGLAGVKDRDAAQALRGLLVLAPESELQPLNDDEFYWHQLIGCAVETEAGTRVGTVAEIWETGAHDVLVVRDEKGTQNLIPTARELTREIDIPAQRIVIADVPGLIDLGELAEASEADG
jgi:16S rRNA processing protein RimM